MLQHGWHYTKWKKWSESEMLVAQLCLTLCDPMDCSLPGSSVYGISQARILEWVSISFSRGSFWPRDQTQVSCSAGGFFIIWATRKAKPVTKGQIVYDLTHMKSFSSVQSSCSVMSNSLWPHGLQHARLLCSSPSTGTCSNSCSSSQWSHPIILSSVFSFSSCFYLSQHQGLFQWVGSSHQMAKVLECQLQHQSFQWMFRVYFLYFGLISL